MSVSAAGQDLSKGSKCGQITSFVHTSLSLRRGKITSIYLIGLF